MKDGINNLNISVLENAIKEMFRFGATVKAETVEVHIGNDGLYIMNENKYWHRVSYTQNAGDRQMKDKDVVASDINLYNARQEDIDIMHENCIEKWQVESLLDEFENKIGNGMTGKKLMPLIENFIANLRYECKQS